MTKIITAYLSAFLVFLLVDAVWLGVVAKNLYQTKLSGLLAPQVNWLAAGLFYLLYVAGLLYFAVMPGIKNGSISQTITTAAVFGLITYATYDLTNQATLRNWPWSVTIIDLIWGVSISIIVAVISYTITTKFF